MVGTTAGDAITSGYNNIIVGGDSDVADAAANYQYVFGYGITSAASTMSIGQPGSIVSNGFTSNATWARNSDLHKKTNIESTDLGLSFINELRPVTFNWKDSSEFPESYKDKDIAEMDTETNLYGMIAQEVKEALDKVGHENFGGWSEDDDGSQKLAQSMFVYPLINAVQELSAKVEELENKLNNKEK